MADFLVELGTNPTARNVIKTLGLPIPMPAKLVRDVGAWQERPLQDRAIVVGSPAGAELTAVIAEAVAGAGGDPRVAGDESALAAWRKVGEAYGRPPTPVGMTDAEEGKPWALVLDATGITDPAGLRVLYDFFHPRVKALGRSGRAIVIGRAPERRKSPAAAAAASALEGFVRSLGREVGRGGATANLVYVQSGAEDRLIPVLRFLLSPRSAYVSGQPWRVESTVELKAAPTVRPLDGKVAVVTGAARGIGAATARALAREGARVVVVDRPEDDAQAALVARECGGKPFLGDVTAADTAERLKAFLVEHYGGVDIVVHNAGITRDKMLGNMDEPRWDSTIEVNLSSVIRLHEGLDSILREGGRVICTSSIAGISGNVGQTNYSASKAGIIGLVKALAPTTKKRAITVNAIAPGFIETRLTAAIPVATREVARRLSNVAQGGLPEDIAEVVTFLATPGSAGVTGQILRVCGGSFVGA